MIIQQVTGTFFEPQNAKQQIATFYTFLCPAARAVLFNPEVSVISWFTGGEYNKRSDHAEIVRAWQRLQREPS